MSLLILGLALWVAGHVFKRLLPGPYEGLGSAGKAAAAAIILAGLVLMVVGFRRAEVSPVYDLGGWARHLNNLLMYGAVVLFGLGHSKGRMRAWLRHPMLTGVIVFAAAHLLVNGDLAAIVLFGGLLLWAVAEILVIDAREPAWTRPTPGTGAGDLRLLAISAAAYVAIGLIHRWIGPSPFPV